MSKTKLEYIETPDNSEVLNSNHCKSENDHAHNGMKPKLDLETANNENTKDEDKTTEANSKNEKEKSTDSEEERFSSIVAAHYNSFENSNMEVRSESRIVYLRNFNNWIKSLLIKEIAKEVRRTSSVDDLCVLDMCCGKGGDLFKWAKVYATQLIGTDIAENSLKDFQSRYQDYLSRSRSKKKLKCEFFPADCTRVRLKEKYRDPNTIFDIVSCQFSFHYCFESLPQAECMLRNASECLKPGGFFIGTIPNANEIVKRVKLSKTKNSVYSIEMCCEEPYPLFGAKYNFYLEGVVNCPEFLVHFPTFERLATKFGFKLIAKERFGDFFEKRKSSWMGKDLLRYIGALQTYSTSNEDRLQGPEYYHAKLACEMSNKTQVGTISKSEWEIISMYLTFVFQKEGARRHQWKSFSTRG